METPLRGRSGGTQAPPLRFRLVGLHVGGWFHLGRLRVDGWFRLGGLRMGRLMSFGWIVRKWLFGLCEIAWKNMMEIGRGGAYVPARAAPQGRIHR